MVPVPMPESITMTESMPSPSITQVDGSSLSLRKVIPAVDGQTRFSV